MSGLNIVIPDPIEIPTKYLEQLRALGTVIYDSIPADETDLIERIKDADVITANYVDITRAVIDNSQHLRNIIVPAVGYEWVDYSYASTKGITVSNCPGFNARAVAEHAIALLFAVNRKIVEATNSLREGNWDHQLFKGTEIQGKSIVLIGYGNVGKQISVMATGLGMKVSYINTATPLEEADQLLKTADFICSTLPLNDSTKHFLNRQRLESLQPHAIVINVGRGATIDQLALAELLASKRLAGAGLDVFDDEPLNGKPNSQIIDLALLPNVVATPHMAYNTHETEERLGIMLVEHINACLSNDPIHRIN